MLSIAASLAGCGARTTATVPGSAGNAHPHAVAGATAELFAPGTISDAKRFAPRQPLVAVNTDRPFDPANPTAD